MLGRNLRVAMALGLAGAALSWWFATHTRPMWDEGAVLTAAAKLLRGGVFYRDIDAYWFPGSAYLAAFAMKLFGEHLSVARILAAISYLGMLLGLYALALRLVGPRRAGLFGLCLLCLKFAAWPALTAYFYWDLAFSAACLAILSMIGPEGARERPPLVRAGFFMGLALLFKQNVGLYLAGVGSVLLLLPGGLPGAGPRLRDRLPDVARLGAGMGIVVLPPLLYFAVHGLLDELIWSAFARPLLGYLPTSGISFWEPLAWWELGSLEGNKAFPYFLMPYYTLLYQGALPGAALESTYWLVGELVARLLYTSVIVAGIATLARATRRWRRYDERDRRLFALAALSAAVGASALPRADLAHLISVYPLILLVLIQLWARWVDGPAGVTRTGIRRAELATVLLGVALVAGLTAVHQSQRSYRLDLPRARVWVSPEYSYLETVVRHVAGTLDPTDRFFVYGNEAHLYFLTGRFYPWPYSQLYPGQTGGHRGAALAALLRAEPPVLVVRGRTGSFAGLPSIPSYAPLLRAQVRRQFVRDEAFFERHPPPTGIVPSRWDLSLWRPRRR